MWCSENAAREQGRGGELSVRPKQGEKVIRVMVYLGFKGRGLSRPRQPRSAAHDSPEEHPSHERGALFPSSPERERVGRTRNSEFGIRSSRSSRRRSQRANAPHVPGRRSLGRLWGAVRTCRNQRKACDPTWSGVRVSGYGG